MKKVTIGSIVHFVMSNGEHRPAVVVRVWDNAHWGFNGLVNMVVFVDGSNDQPEVRVGEPGQLAQWVTSVRYSDKPEPWTWHWPEEA